MTWNYRIMKSYPDSRDAWYSIREVYYNNDGEVTDWTVEEIAPESETIEGLLEMIQLMRNCLDKPILDEAELQARIKPEL